MFTAAKNTAKRTSATKFNIVKFITRRLCIKPSTDTMKVPLTEALPWIPVPIYASAKEQLTRTQVTVLGNGLRVASENKFGQFCTVGVVVDSGSRYEAMFPGGVTHFLEKIAFGATDKFSNRDHIMQTLEKVGGICDSQTSRDTLVYAASANTDGLEQIVELLSQVVFRPQLKEEEVMDVQQAIEFEVSMMDIRPDPEPILAELIHKAAFRNSTLGLPKICPKSNIPVIQRGTLYSYLNNYHTPQRMVLSGVGVEHQALVQLAVKYFQSCTPIWLEQPGLIDQKRPIDLSPAKYTGGQIQVEKDLSDVSLGPTPMPELAHCVIGLQSCSYRDEDFIAVCVLNMMLGGGGSFSAGGPGKGMYTRLYTNVLNKYHWMYNATAYNHAYCDTGLFCINASAPPSSLKNMVEVVTKEFVKTQSNLTTSELNRAKRQLQSMLLMNLESRPVVFEDVGRQVLAYNERLPPEHYYQQIAKVTSDDITRVAKRMLATPPSVVAYGDVSQMPNYEQITSALRSNSGELPRRFSIFR